MKRYELVMAGEAQAFDTLEECYRAIWLTIGIDTPLPDYVILDRNGPIILGADR